MGKLTNLNPPAAIADSDIPAPIARDTEVSAALAAHIPGHPHPQYLTLLEGDGRYRTFTGQEFDTGTKVLGKSNGSIFSETNACGFEIRGISSSAAYLSFHRPGSWGVHLGLDVDNQFKIGGWSLGNNAYRVWHEGHGTPVWQTPSDGSLKEKIRPIPSGLALILESKPISFQYKKIIRASNDFFGNKFQRHKIHYGFLANDFPLQDLVFEKNGYLGLDYVEIIPFLVKAIQELHAEVTDLKKKVELNTL